MCIWEGVRAMAAKPPKRSRQDAVAYAPCVLCGVPVLAGETLHGETLHLDVTQPCYCVAWANEAKVPTLFESRAYVVHTCRENPIPP
jgi:hypothetical protein